MRNSFKNTRKAIAGASAFALIAANLVVLPSASAKFSDVAMDNWAYDYIMDLVDMGIVDGNPDGTFRPDASVNRAEMAKIVTNLGKKSGVVSSDDTMGAPAFRDVPAGEWFTDFVSVAAKNNLFEGYRDTEGNLTGFFGPGNMVNRAEASKVLLLAAGVPEMLTPGAPFVDVKSNDWFYPYVTSAYNWSIVDGYKNAAGDLTGSFGPGDAMTRAQISKVAVLAQDPIDRYTGIPLNEMDNGNTNEGNTNTNTGTGENMNQNSGETVSNVSFEAKLSPSSPASTQVATGTAFNTVAVFDLTAGADEDVNVNEVTVLSRGFISDSSINGVVIRDGDGMRHGNIVNFSNSSATIGFGSNPIVVKAGMTQRLIVELNFAGGTTTGTVGVELPADKIMATGAATSGKVKVTTPATLAGAIHTLVSGANVGSVTFDNVVITAGNQLVDLGITNKEIAKFRLSETGSNEDVMLTELTVFNNGNTSDTDLENIKLVDQDGKILAEVKNTSNRYATFDLSAAPYMISKGTSRNLSIHADIINGSTRTIQFVVSNDYDMKVMGANSKAFLLPSAGTVDTTFPIGDATGNNTLEVREGTLTVSKSNTSPSGEIARGTTEVTIGEFRVEAAGEDIEIQGGTLGITGTNIPGDLKGTYRLVNGSGATIHSINANTVTGSFAVTRFNNYYTVKAGTVGMLKVVVDIADAAFDGNTLTATVEDLNIKKISSNRNGVAAETAIQANAMSITAASVAVASNASANLSNVVRGSSNQKIGSFNLSTTNSSAVNISSIVMNLTPTYPGGAQIFGVTNLKLMSDGVQLGSTIATPATSNNTFGISGQMNIPLSSNRTIDVYADVASTSTATSLQSSIPLNTVIGTAGNNQVSAPTAAAATLQSVTLVDSGTLTVERTNDVPNGRVMVAGESNVRLLSVKAEANNNEDIRLERLFVSVTDGSKGSVSSLSLLKGGVVIAGPRTLTGNTAEFAGLGLVIPRDDLANLVVAATLSNGTSFNSGASLVGTVTGFEAYGQSSGARQLNQALTLDGPTMTLQNVVPQFATMTEPKLLIKQDDDVAKFKISTNGNESLSIRELNFTASGSFSATGSVTNYKLYRVSDGVATQIAGSTDNVNGILTSPTFDLAAAFPVVAPNANLSGYEISRGNTVEFLVRADTSGIKTGADNAVSFSLSLPGVAGGAGSVEYSYKTATTTTGIAPTTVLNDYPITVASHNVN